MNLFINTPPKFYFGKVVNMTFTKHSLLVNLPVAGLLSNSDLLPASVW